MVAPVWRQGFVLGGSACGGGGNEKRCTGIARQLSLVEVSPRAWGYVAGGVLCILLGAAALLLTRNRAARIALAAAVLVRRLRRTRSDDTDRREARPFQRRRHVRASDGGLGSVPRPHSARAAPGCPAAIRGKRTEPGGPLYERELILDSFFVRPQDGWRFLRAAIVVLFFAAGLETVPSHHSSPDSRHRHDRDGRDGDLGARRRAGDSVQSRWVGVLRRASDALCRGGRRRGVDRLPRGVIRRPPRGPVLKAPWLGSACGRAHGF